jgi:hypothetical protein
MLLIMRNSKCKFDLSILTLPASPRFLTAADMRNRLAALEQQIKNGNRGLIKMYEHLVNEMKGV